MLPNLSYTTPTIGRITIGDIYENERGKRLPVCRNYFSITAQHKENGEWAPHPIQAEVLKKMRVDKDKLTEIPVKVMFNSPDLTIRERYEAYDAGRMVCASCGNNSARRITAEGMSTVACHGPEACVFAREAEKGCQLMARINLQIDAKCEDTRDDPMSSFILRTSGYNSAKTLRAKLDRAHAMFNGKIIGLPFMLTLRTKSSSLSMDSPYYYVDLVLNCSLMEGAKFAKENAQAMEEAGINQEEFEKIALAGITNGPFEDTIEEMVELEDLLIGRGASQDSTTTTSGQPVTLEIVGSKPEEKATASSDEISLDGLRNFLESSKGGQQRAAA